MLNALLIALLLAQASPVRVVDPADQTKAAGVSTVGAVKALNVNCVGGCAATISLGDAGLSFSGWTPDGGNIGYMRMPDGGPLEVYTVNSSGSSGGGWVPDGGFIGSVAQGPSRDGGVLWAVESPSFVDLNNTTTTPLAGNATFTGAATRVYSAVVSIVVQSNVASATNGFQLQSSPDGTNWDHVHLNTYAAGTSMTITGPLQLPYFRVVYTNGASAQASFRLTTMMHPSAQSGSIVALGDLPTDYDHGQITQSVLIGRTTAGGGSYVAVKVNPSGALAADVTGTVSATQGTSPWVVNTHAVTQGTGIDGGQAWNVAPHAVTQSTGFDGGAAWGVTQSNNDNLRTRTASEGDAGRNAGLYAPSLAGFRDSSNALRDARVFDTDTSGGTEWTLGSAIVTQGFGGASVVSGANDDQGNLGIAVYSIPIFNHSSPTNTAVTCSYSTPTLAPTTRRTSRSYISLKNTSGDQTVYIGGSSVSRANGYPLNPLESFEWRIVENTDYYCISGNADAGTIEIRVLEH